MHWTILLVSAVLEAVWANALQASAGFTRLAPTLLFLVTTVMSSVGLGIAMRRIPTGTAYAVWTSVGSVLTVLYATATGNEQMSVVKALLLAGIVGCVGGLKLLDQPAGTPGAGVTRRQAPNPAAPETASNGESP